MGAHAPIAPSALHRHMRCAGAFAAEEDLPDTQSDAAAEGTTAHSYAALLLNGSTEADAARLADAEELEEAKRQGREPQLVDDDMRRHVADYVRLVESLAGPDDITLIEQRVKVVPFCWGTGDALIIHADGERITAVDLKYGFIPVRVEGNEQLLAYLLGHFKRYDGLVGKIRQARGVIFQPRNGGMSSALWKRADLVRFEKDLVKTIRNSADPYAKRTATAKGCQWCKAKPTCPEYKAFVESKAAPAFVDVTETPITA